MSKKEPPSFGMMTGSLNAIRQLYGDNTAEEVDKMIKRMHKLLVPHGVTATIAITYSHSMVKSEKFVYGISIQRDIDV